MQPISWSRPEPCEVLIGDRWVKWFISHHPDGRSVADPTKHGLAIRIQHEDRREE